MKYTEITKYLLCLTGILFLSGCQSEIDKNAADKEIKKVWENTINAICTGNWPMFEKCLAHTENIQVIHPSRGEILQGWQEVENHYKEVLSSDFRCYLEKNKLSVTISQSGDVAWGTADMIVQFNDSIGSTMHLWHSTIFEKSNEKWELVYLLTTRPTFE